MGTRAPLPSWRRAGQELAAQRCCLRFLPVIRLRPPLLLPGPSPRGGQRPRTREASPAAQAPPSWAGTPPTPMQRGLLGAPHLHTHNRGRPPGGRAPRGSGQHPSDGLGTRSRGQSPHRGVSEAAANKHQHARHVSRHLRGRLTPTVPSEARWDRAAQGGARSPGHRAPLPAGLRGCYWSLQAQCQYMVARDLSSASDSRAPPDRTPRGPHGTFQEASPRAAPACWRSLQPRGAQGPPANRTHATIIPDRGARPVPLIPAGGPSPLKYNFKQNPRVLLALLLMPSV